MLYEIRNYHFRPDLFEAQKTWIRAEALPFLGKQMDIVGFWTNLPDAPEVKGAAQDALGCANITWIIRWRDMAHRNEVWSRVFASREWRDMFARVPGGPSSYLRLEAKFAEALA